MARQHISLKTRVRYDGKAQIIDRRAPSDTLLENVPSPVYRMVTQMLRSKFRKPAPAKKTRALNSAATALPIAPTVPVVPAAAEKVAVS